jgi:hypothetical protein
MQLPAYDRLDAPVVPLIQESKVDKITFGSDLVLYPFLSLEGWSIMKIIAGQRNALSSLLDDVLGSATQLLSASLTINALLLGDLSMRRRGSKRTRIATFARMYIWIIPFHYLSHRLLYSANRVLKALLLNGGIYIKLGQHVSSLYVVQARRSNELLNLLIRIIVPKEWSSTFRPLQDKCTPSEYNDLEVLFKSDLGESIDEVFETFHSEPIGVASLAQVHVAKYRKTGEEVAVKVQHPSLREFAEIDMRTVEVIVGSLIPTQKIIGPKNATYCRSD